MKLRRHDPLEHSGDGEPTLRARKAADRANRENPDRGWQYGHCNRCGRWGEDVIVTTIFENGYSMETVCRYGCPTDPLVNASL